MSPCVTDTHGLIWYVLNAPELSPTAKKAMTDAALAGEAVYVPSICLVEIVYLIEKYRFPPALLQKIRQLLADPDSELTIYDLTEPVTETLEQISRLIVPDMPDRIVAATALYLNLPLITRDAKIQSSQVQTIW